MKHQAFVTYVLMIYLAAVSSCTLSIKATLRPDTQIDLSYTSEIKPKIAALFKDLNGSHQNTATPLLSAQVVTASLQKVPELSQVITRESAQALEGSLRITKLEALSQRFPFIIQKKEGSENLLNLSINRDTARQLVGLFTTDVRDYLEALMAPVITGEELSAKEYLDLLSSVYGKTIAQEIEASRVSLKFQVPGTITRVIGGTSSGGEAVFAIPLIDLLVVQKPLFYQLVWK
ncbi:MAG TPA: hypothetical protein PLB48_02335 [Treponema sp.]|nr:hypothetical protein [Treponema sp.]HPC70621.1 hypothetical protein [Treponema sp.]HRS03075.1 hypothetical protein [Treponema sp.]HRU27869.1 hypothetical protein [Treponema sp.]